MLNNDLKMLRIVSSNFVVGVVIANGKVLNVPNLLYYIKGWDERRLMRYIKTKGWEFEVIKYE